MNEQMILGPDGLPLAADTAHRGASLSARELSSWRPMAGSPDADLLDELSTLVSRSRDLARNHGVAAGAIQTLVDNVVGTGLRLSALPDYKALGKDKDWADSWSRKTEALWRSWAETTDCDAARNLTFNGLTAQMFRSGLINGEAFALPLWLPQRNQTFATTIQLVEPDCLGNPNDRLNDRKIRGGIEVDIFGAPLAYWIAKTHPGDQLLGVAGLGQEFERKFREYSPWIVGDQG